MGDRRISAQPADVTPLVLIVDDDPEITALLTELLTGDGLRCETARDGRTAVELAMTLRPQLVLLDLSLPVLSGDEVFACLRADHRTRYIPIVFLTAAGNRKAVISHLLAGGDDYVTKPFDIEELSARVQATLRRARTLGGLNPISGLPGNSAIHEEMTERLRDGRTFACVYLDIDHFKPFNDHYGFTRGDMLILALAEAIFAAVESAGSDAFLGHIGGDDFVMLCDPDRAEALAADVIERFRSAARALHDEADTLGGGYEA
ncbi:MAG: response regulator, partial [Chloroflexota bacterium]|nr:response regulator [Chloroflexota bacterium]